MKKLVLLLTAMLVSVGVFKTNASKIEPLADSLRTKYGFVDPFLASTESIGNLPMDNESWPIFYILQVNDPQPFSNFSGVAVEEGTHPLTGKKVRYYLYEEPYYYYMVLGLPDGSGKAYSIISTGFNSINEIVGLAPEQWHPFTKVAPVYMEIVKNDGTHKTSVCGSGRPGHGNLLSNPNGSYWLHKQLGYRAVNIKFNPDGTGTLTAEHRAQSWVLSTYDGGSYTIERNIIERERVNRHTGGYEVWMQPIAKRGFKWSTTSDGKIKIVPQGVTTVELKEGIDDNPDQYYTSEKQRQLHIAQRKKDFATNNEAREYRNFYKAMAKNHLEKFDEIEFEPYYMYADEMLGLIKPTLSHKDILDPEKFVKDSNDADGMKQRVQRHWQDITKAQGQRFAYFKNKRIESDMDMPYLAYEGVGKVKSMVDKNKPAGIESAYAQMVEEMKTAIAAHPEVFGTSPSYEARFIDPISRTLRIMYIYDHKPYHMKMKFDDNYNVDFDQSKQSAKYNDIVDKYVQQLTTLNDEIMQYKKDSAHKNELKEYEKEYKKMNFAPQFNAIEEIDPITYEFFNMTKRQKALLNTLKN